MTGQTTDPAGPRPMSVGAISDLYAEQADTMDRLDWLNRLVTGRYRRRLFGTAEGRVLDVACGTGTNRRYLPDPTEYVGIDVSREMLAKARDRFGAGKPEAGARLLEMDAQALAFPDDSFDTVVSSLSTCTFPAPERALGEMGRVCRPDGRILLLEHGRSDVGPVARFQDWRADTHYEKHGCRWNQEPVAVVSGTGLSIRAVSEGLLGVITAIEARPE